MNDKTPIEPADIRAGDTIRFEYAVPHSPNGAAAQKAVEYVATGNSSVGYALQSGQHFLLARAETFVRVPQSAIDALVQANEAAFDITARTQEDWERKNELRLDAIIGFLDTIGVDY